MKQIMESLVLGGQNKVKLRYFNVQNEFKLYVVEGDGREQIVFEENKDYILDRKNGLICRTDCSRIPDFSTHALNDLSVFTLQDGDGKYSNKEHIVFADYEFDERGQFTTEYLANRLAERNGNKGKLSAFLAQKENIKLLVFGDSISCGCEARDVQNMYFNRFVDFLKLSCDKDVSVVNMSRGGYNTDSIKEDFEKKVKLESADLAFIAFGMNDHCQYDGEDVVSVDKYEKNINYFLDNLKVDLPVLISPCKPNFLWKTTGKYITEFVAVLNKISKERNIPFVNVTELWQTELDAGKRPCDMLNNNVNHPTDYGHYVYFLALKALL